MNKVICIGRLTQDVEVRYTQTGKGFANFMLAVPREYNSKEADFIRCQAWERQAENLAKFIHKGGQVAVQGHIQTGSYDKDGQTVYTWQVVCERVEFLGAPKTEIAEPMTPSGFEQYEAEIPY